MASWYIGTLEESHMVADNVKCLRFVVPDAPTHQAGQHYDVKLTAPDGYVAERSYSLANPPEDRGIVELGVELLEGGEVSPFLYALEPGGQVELRGPIGGHFVWEPTFIEPLVLLGGGSGFVPLMSMVRQYVLARAAGDESTRRDIRIFISARTEGKIVYLDELRSYAEKYPELKLFFAVTESIPADWENTTGQFPRHFARRADAAMLTEVCGDISTSARVYICGPNAFVEAVSDILTSQGFGPTQIKTERFGGK